MALREIIQLPDPRLRIKSDRVSVFDEHLKRLVDDMTETMYAAKGIGLAAVQIAVHKRVLILDIGDLNSDEKYIEGDDESESRLADRRTVKNLQIFINPEIIKSAGSQEYEEGCLSVPGVYSTVTRKEQILLRYQDLKGQNYEMQASGLLSIVLQHEMDHLDGVVFTDRLGPMQRMVVLDKYNKLRQTVEEPVEE